MLTLGSMSLGGDWFVIRICFCLAIPSRNFPSGSVQLGADLVCLLPGAPCVLVLPAFRLLFPWVRCRSAETGPLFASVSASRSPPATLPRGRCSLASTWRTSTSAFGVGLMPFFFLLPVLQRSRRRLVAGGRSPSFLRCGDLTPWPFRGLGGARCGPPVFQTPVLLCAA